METSALLPHKNHYSIRNLSFLLLFLVTLLLISWTNLEPQLSFYRNLSLSSRSIGIPISSSPQPDENEATFSDRGVTVPISSKSNLEEDPSSDVTGTDGEDASKSNLGGETIERSANADIINETSTFETPSSSKSDYVDENRGKEALPDGKEASFKESFSSASGNDDRSKEDPSASSNSDSGGHSSRTNAQEVGPVSETDINNLTLWTSCDFYKGKWVKDEEYPLYKPGSCPYVDDAFDCQSNGRPDSEYLKWRWQPDGCDLPRFNSTDFLVRLRGKRLMLVGDSMNRNQFESLLCLLREGLHNKSKMYEVHGYKISKGRGYFSFRFEDYDCSVEFVRSHFLVREGVRINGQGNSNPTLSIDRIDKSSGRWKRADILVFNTAHWWTHGKTARGKNYYKEGNVVYPKFDAIEAYRRALKTWSKWIDSNTKRGKLIFYRGYSSAHFRGGDWDSGGTCMKETEPVLSGSILDNYPLKMKIVEEVINDMKVPVMLLNVTKLTNFRKDGHPSVYGKKGGDKQKVSAKKQDCSHWCLPGVPDAWNELIYATLVANQTPSSTN